MRFAVFTHVAHIRKGVEYYAYTPYVREMNIWFRHTEEAEVVGPLKRETEKIGGEPYDYKNLRFTEIPAFNLLSLRAALMAVFRIPVIFFRIFGAMRRAEHLHLRCPGNIGLLACIVQVFFPGKPKTAKYAGNWDPEAEQPWTYKLQKWILSNSFLTRNIQVLVYGEWPGQTKNILPFFTASFSEKDNPVEKDFKTPCKFIYTGNLVPGKGVFKAVDLIAALNKNYNGILEIYGDGPLEADLGKYISAHGLEEFISLKGRKSLEELKQAYKEAHFVILLSKSEGWPKAIAEGMWFGCIPVATPVSCVPWMLGHGSRGILLSCPGKESTGSKKLSVVSCELSEDVGKLKGLINDPQELKQMSEAAKEWSQQYTLERFEEAIKEVLKEP